MLLLQVVLGPQRRTGFTHPGNTQKPFGVFWVKPVEKPSKKTTPNLIQFQFVVPVIIKDLTTAESK